MTRVTKINAIFNILVRNIDKRCSHMLMPATKIHPWSHESIFLKNKKQNDFATFTFSKNKRYWKTSLYTSSYFLEFFLGICFFLSPGEKISKEFLSIEECSGKQFPGQSLDLVVVLCKSFILADLSNKIVLSRIVFQMTWLLSFV